MVSNPPIWTPWGLAGRLRRAIRQPADLWLALRIGLFLWSAPRRMEQCSLPEFLGRLADLPRPPASDLAVGVERIARLRGLWLRRRFFRSRNTCYLRALALFRFLDCAGHSLRIHYGVEPGSADERHRGHAWVTVDGVVWEAPGATLAGRVQEIFAYPAAGAMSEAATAASSESAASALRCALFDLLYGTFQQTEQAIAMLDRSTGWAEAIRLAEAWRVLPRLARRIRRRSIALNPAGALILRERMTACALRSGYVARRAGEVAAALEARGVDAVAFKGVASLALLYRSPAERMLSDIDLIVREDDLEAAMLAIREAGFYPWIEGSVEELHNFSDRRIRRDNYGVKLVDAEGLEVDLHYRLWGGVELLLEQGVWNRAERVPLMGRSVRVVSRLDAILLATHHALRNQFFPYPTLRDLGDIADYWASAETRLDIAELARLARECGLEAPLLGLLAVLEAGEAIRDENGALPELRRRLGNTAIREGDRLRAWLHDGLRERRVQGGTVWDMIVLLADPPALVRLIWDRAVEGRKSAGYLWRWKQDELRAERGARDSARVRRMLAAALRMNRRQWGSVIGMVRAQRRAMRSARPILLPDR